MISKTLNILFIVALLCSCNNDSPTRVIDRPSLLKSSPAIKVEIENRGSVNYGDTIYMKVYPVKDEITLAKVVVELIGTNRILAESTDGNIKIATINSGGGNLRFKIEAEFSSGEKSNRYKDITVVSPEKANNWGFEVVERYPHNAHAYTQGLLVHDGFLYEGTGQYGTSKIMKTELTTGKVLKEESLSSDYFGEGITIFDNKIYQLTYKAGKAFVYDLSSFETTGEFRYSFKTAEGWGLTNNDSLLIASDGSELLYFINPEDFRIVSTLQIFDENGSVENINELEYRNGIIYANIYTTARIVAIDAKTGRVMDNYNARGIMLQSEATADMDVLNGIAFNPLNGNFLITGKNWSKLYEVRPIPANS
ncbi:glutaminyl-peptide cyclotransferase [Cryomorpha ignava]|uniref:Glutaminyl-peptide cyclotransferase n=1 Tax=Cryomorpha ignava TaxID=101383 RepID=A0A7K3WKN0_9FLAO|nr:glutaminyl-peptide cyclotransferase [Cryomorpha ignava]NEN22203.1 glutaminyl-peptide cyclotransferase [Cryomorpha ignava]